jgi:transaldolase
MMWPTEFRDVCIPEGKRVDPEKWPTHAKHAYESKKKCHQRIDEHVDELTSPKRLHYTMPERTLFACADHGVLKGSMPHDGCDAEAALVAVAAARVDEQTVGAPLHREGSAAFVKSWSEPMPGIASQRTLP